MKMQTRHYIAPRVQVQELRSRYTTKALSTTELKAVLSALKLTGIPDAATRFMDDAVRYAMDTLLKEI